MTIWRTQVEQYQRIDSLEAVRDTIRHLQRTYPVKHVFFSIGSSGQDNTVRTHLAQTAGDDWFRLYVDQNYALFDPVWIRAKRSVEPVDWSSTPKRGRTVKRLLADAIDHGIGANGVTIPVHSLDGVSSWTSVSSELSDREWHSFMSSHLGEIVVMAQMLHGRVAELLAPQTKPEVTILKLGNMEELCLSLVSQGQTMSEIADKLGIAERSVRSHLLACRTKLASRSTAEAIGKMYRYRLW